MPQLRYLLVLALFVIAPSISAAAEGDSAKAKTEVALKQVESWLGPGATGDGWVKYLDLAALHRELERSGPVDVATVSQVLAKLNSGAKGLDRPQFKPLQSALAAWVDELNLPGPEALGDAVKSAASQFHPISPQDLDQARAAVLRESQELSAYFGRLGAVGPGWQKYLRLADLNAQVQPGAAADRDVLAKIAERFAADKPGLEMAQVRAAGSALKSYYQLLDAAANDNLSKQYESEIGGLSEWLGKYSSAPGEESAAEVNRRLGWLDQMHQGENLVRSIRRAFEKPNLFVAAKTQIVGAGIERALNDVMPLRDNINGTQISGTGRTVGQLKVELVPDARRATFDIMLSGVTYSNTVGYNGPATIYSQGTTSVGGRKRVMIDATGIHNLPSTAAAITKTRITGVAAGRPGGLINNIAQRKVAEGKGQAEQIAAQHAEARIRTRLDKEAAKDLGNAHHDFMEKFRNPLVRQNLFPTLFDFSTTKDLLHVTVLQADQTQLGAPGAPPELNEKDCDLAVRLHESAANNLAASLLSGVTLRDEEVRNKIVELRGSLPDQLKDQEDQEPWSITFEKFRPVSVSIRDGGVEIVIRGRRYTTGENDKNKYGAMYVTARYKTEKLDKGYRLVRQGELSIEPPKEGRQSTKVVALKAILRKKFAKLFPETVEPQGLELPGKWKNAGKLWAAHVQTDGGWATIGYRRSPSGDNVASRAK